MGDDGFEEAFDGLFAAARTVARRLVGGGAAADDVAAEGSRARTPAGRRSATSTTGTRG